MLPGTATLSFLPTSTGISRAKTSSNGRPGWLDSVDPDHNDAAASIGETIAEGYVSPPATPPSNFQSKGEKRRRPKVVTAALRCWVEHFHTPYATLEEKKLVAEGLNISVAKVTNFLNNYRKRYAKVAGKLTSWTEAAR